MARTILGIDVGRETLKLALVKNGRVVKTAKIPMPENLLQDGRIVSPELMSDLLKQTMKENGLHAGKAAFVLPNEVVYVKNVEMPLMTIDQLQYNLPFEFNDYITGEVQDYVFDYAVLSGPADEKKKEKQKKVKKEKPKKEKPKKDKKTKNDHPEQEETAEPQNNMAAREPEPAGESNTGYTASTENGFFSASDGIAGANPVFQNLAGSFYDNVASGLGGDTGNAGEGSSFGNGAKAPHAGSSAVSSGNQGSDSRTDKDNGSEEEAASKDFLDLMVVAAVRGALEDAQEIARQAGMKLTMAAPSISAYISLIRSQHKSLSQVAEEYGILDLGYDAVRMYMFRGERHQATRVLEIGLSSIDSVISDIYGVDVHLAHTYLTSNYENCQERPECMAAYENIAVELMRALNFYRFSNPDSSLSDLWLCGGGADIPMLSATIGEMLDKQLHRAEELVPGGEKIESCNSYVQAIGIALS